ncbi:hypothetical protein Sme01_61360 [Sphaerisporangium melleum]|uniref:Uncharacterized protein n=1 Tax=Sphaerisporangium melleum TaxID=321316 RepID=A0A917RAS8_9ACTN|nr:putative TOMM peptide [Sphaerisporangium melleum]GGK97757.1 hypothetical protein GCM10007964_44980 [Sphaerisporangium melleum]GII73660.1 hypothetical protein Sme01_61360 [Sphaerisporangium melleum]
MTVDTIGWDTAQRRAFGELTAKAWFDAGLRLRYEREPRSVLAEYDIRLADGACPPVLPPEPRGELEVELLTGTEAPPPPPCMLSLCFCLAVQ